MTIYNFNLLQGDHASGVEYAQGYRANLFRKLALSSKFIFTEIPTNQFLTFYTDSVGLKEDELVSIHFSFLENASIIPQLTFNDIISDFPAINDANHINEGENYWNYFKDGKHILSVVFTDSSKQIIDYVASFSDGILMRKDFFTNRKVYSEYYHPKNVNNHSYAKLFRRVYYHPDTVAFEEIFDGDQSLFIWPYHTMHLSKYDLIVLFLQNLKLTSKDWIICDRTSSFDFAQAILMAETAAKLAAVIHSEHYFETDYDPNYLYVNYEYYYLLKYVDAFDLIITSTELQKEKLEAFIFNQTQKTCHIKVIPVGSSTPVTVDFSQKKPFSLMTASRLQHRKNVDILIEAVSLAKKVIPELSFDIYGTGPLEKEFYHLIQDCKAEDYIKLKGHGKLDNLYPKYELYTTASLWETFGLTLLEACSYGLALVGLDVPYGNQTFIKNGGNGFLVDYDYDMDREQVILNLSQAIINFFQLSQLERYNYYEQSLKISSQFDETLILEAWKESLTYIDNL